jgi:hypothetical protein
MSSIGWRELSDQVDKISAIAGERYYIIGALISHIKYITGRVHSIHNEPADTCTMEICTRTRRVLAHPLTKEYES